MCALCDGGTHEELFTNDFIRIAIDGFVLVGVDAPMPWMYTIGLVQSFAHPELVMTGPGFEVSAHLLSHTIERIRNGDRFTATSPPMSPCDCTVAFGPVHPAQWEYGRFANWVAYYDWLGGEPPARKAIQVLWRSGDGRFPPDPQFCPHHPSCQPVLDGAPTHDVHRGVNREERRRRQHGRRRE